MSTIGLIIGEYHRRRRRPLATRRHQREHWRRRAGLVVGLATLLVGAGVLGWWLLTDPRFAIDRVETGPYRFTEPAELEERLATMLGQNIWTFSTSDLTASIRELPWVREVTVVRRLPGTLKVKLTEWTPLLTVAPAAGEQARGRSDLVLVGDGRVLSFPAELPPPGLPVLAEARLTFAGADSWCLVLPQVAAVLELVAAVASTGLEAVCPIDFIVPGQAGLTLILQRGRGRLLLGREQFQDRLERFLVARQEVPPGTEVDLRFRGRIATRKPDPRSSV